MEWILEHRADDHGKKTMGSSGEQGQMKENSWRGRREERPMKSKRSLDAEQAQRFQIFQISVAF